LVWVIYAFAYLVLFQTIGTLSPEIRHIHTVVLGLFGGVNVMLILLFLINILRS
jgi:hypothetical protein